MKSVRYEKSGFTLLELLIVVAIVGILAAICIPVFREYSVRGYNSAAMSDLRNLKSLMESAHGNSQAYPLY